MRNPALKPRHWTLIEEVIGYKFDPESPLTLGTLTELSVFDHAEAIQEVSGQASSESSLESILKKVYIIHTIHTLSIYHDYERAHVVVCCGEVTCIKVVHYREVAFSLTDDDHVQC